MALAINTNRTCSACLSPAALDNLATSLVANGFIYWPKSLTKHSRHTDLHEWLLILNHSGSIVDLGLHPNTSVEILLWLAQGDQFDAQYLLRREPRIDQHPGGHTPNRARLHGVAGLDIHGDGTESEVL